MKHLKPFLFLSLILILAISFVSCGDTDTESADDIEKTEQVEVNKKAADSKTMKAKKPAEATEKVSTEIHGHGDQFTSAYVCPMHCVDSGSDKAGSCPKCGMDYIAQADHTHDGHSHK